VVNDVRRECDGCVVLDRVDTKLCSQVVYVTPIIYSSASLRAAHGVAHTWSWTLGMVW